MEVQNGPVVDSPGSTSVEVIPVLKAELVEALLTRLEAGEPVKRLAQEYGVDRKTIRAWRARGQYQARRARPRRSRLDRHAAWLTARAPEVDYNAAVLYRELVAHFQYTGSSQQVLRFVRPLRVAARPARATVRFETAPGQQAQVDFGQRRVWIADVAVTAHVFVCTLGYSRRVYVQALPHERWRRRDLHRTMNFLIADTFTASLARLTGDEQKAAKTTAFDLQVDPSSPGLSFHKLDRAKDKNFWSVRVNRDVRLIVHKTVGSFLLCHVRHHDDA